jgi:16S rRNA (cytidine1402-2'-O)-methyltransferase
MPTPVPPAIATSPGRTTLDEVPPRTASRGCLAVVATPLGNVGDVSDRARDTLRTADLILAEDTRSARRLLSEVGASRAGQLVLSCFDANEEERARDAVDRIAAGQTVALVSEAGTPLVSDPGFRVVTAVIAAGLRVRPIPGPSALLAALMGAGIAPDRFTFLGFPPRKSGARQRLFESLRASPFTLVLYESPLRAADTLADLVAVLGGERAACLARELTKTYEEFVRGSLLELWTRYQHDRPLGEVTLVIAGVDPARADDADWSDEELAEEAGEQLTRGLSARDVTDGLAARVTRPRRDIYKLVIALARERRQAAGAPPLDDPE